MRRSFEGVEPQIADSAYVDDAAVVIGDVIVEDAASIWPNTTVRGDHGQIVVGAGTNVQDNAVLHEGVELGRDVTVGHSAIVHGAIVAGTPAEPKRPIDDPQLEATAERYIELATRYEDASDCLDRTDDAP